MRGFHASSCGSIAGLVLLVPWLLASCALAPCVQAAWLLAATGQDDRLTRLETQFSHESDPVRKAKMLSRLQAEQFDSARKSAGSGHADEALHFVEQYRDNVRAVRTALDATAIDAEKRPDGFKQLQISLRESIRELNDLSLSVPMDQRSPFDAIRQELEVINKQVLHRLFPRRPGHKKDEP